MLMKREPIYNLKIAQILKNNIKTRKSQYLSLIMGIILTVTFIAVMALLIGSIYSSAKEYFYSKYSKADFIFVDTAESTVQEFVRDGIVTDYGVARVIGYVQPEEQGQGLGFDYGSYAVASLDARAKEYLQLELYSGRMPEKAGEIALEASALRMLGKSPELGDEIIIPLHFLIGTDKFSSPEPAEKPYTVVGIVKDKNAAIMQSFTGPGDIGDGRIPLAYVAAAEPLTAGTVPAFVIYSSLDKSFQAEVKGWTKNDIRQKFGLTGLNMSHELEMYSRDLFTSVMYRRFDFAMPITLVAILACALVLAAIFGTRNSMRSVLDSKSRQIAMMRAVGATRRQIVILQMKETLSITTLTIPPAILLAVLMLKLAGRYLPASFTLFFHPLLLLGIVVFSLVLIFMTNIGQVVKVSRIPPMQAIRNIDLVRKLKRHKVVSKRNFSPSRLLAARNTILYSGRLPGISLFLALCLAIAMYAGGLLQIKMNRGEEYKNDYILQHYLHRSPVINSTYQRPAFSENDLDFIRKLPLVDTVLGIKEFTLNLEVGEATPYFIMDGHGPLGFISPGPDGYSGMIDPDLYYRIKEKYGFETEFIPFTLLALPADALQDLLAYKAASRVDLAAINAGRSVIVNVPVMNLTYYEEYGASLGLGGATDYFQKPGKTTTYENDYFRAGDSLSLRLLRTDEELDEAFPFRPDVNLPDQVDSLASNVEIAEVFSSDYPDVLEHRVLGNFAAITTLEGMANLGFDGSYCEILVNMQPRLSQETAAYVETALEQLTWRVHGSYLVNQRQFREAARKEFTQTLITAAAVFIVLASICGSIISNNISARIRSSKRAIGTVRAVGAPKNMVWKSFFYQIRGFFLIGTILGLILGTAVLIYLYQKYEAAFSPWPLLLPLAFIVILLSLVSLGAYRKVSRIMKRSIVQNIREFVIIAGLLLLPALLLVPGKNVQAKTKAPPRLMIEDFQVEKEGGGELLPGDEVTLRILLKNMQPGLKAKNIAITCQAEDNAVIPLVNSSYYIDSIPAWNEEEWVFPAKIPETAVPGLHAVSFSWDYQDPQGNTYNGSQIFYLELEQELRLEYDDLIYTNRMIQGEVLDFSLNIMNLGKGSINNVLLQTKITGLSEGISSLVGTIEPGQSNKGTLSVYIKPDQEVKAYDGTILLSYEDERGRSYSQELPVKLEVQKKVEFTPSEKTEQQAEAAFPYTWVIGLGSIILILLIIVIVQAVRIRKYRAAEEARL